MGYWPVSACLAILAVGLVSYMAATRHDALDPVT
jgi:hypothetical protein